jgi:hypothetical protein
VHELYEITPHHADGTRCVHARSPSGTSRHAGAPLDGADLGACPGRDHYRCACGCGWEVLHRVRGRVGADRAEHRDLIGREAAFAVLNIPTTPED